MKLFLITIISIITLAGCGGAEERKAVYLEKAKLSMGMNDLDKARIELKNALQIDPKDAQVYFQLGKVLELQKKLPSAFANYKKSAELDPDNLLAHAKLGTFYLILAGDIDKAIEEKNIILAKQENNIDGLLLNAGILVIQNDVVGAKKISQDIYARQPGNSQNTIFLSKIYLNEKKYDDVIEILNVCIKENPTDNSLVEALASTYLLVGKYDLAENEYKRILELTPDVFLNYLKTAVFYKKSNQIKKAEEILRTAISMDEEDFTRKLALVDFLEQTAGNQVAIDELKLLIAKNPRLGDYRFLLAKLNIAEDDFEAAEKTLKLAVSDFSEEPTGTKARVYLADLYLKNENISAAWSVIDDAVQISPNDTEVNFIKARLLFVKKDYEGAIILLRTVVKDDQENIVAYLMLSTAHRIKGEEEMAGEILEQAYENNKTNTKGLGILANYHAVNKNNLELSKVVDTHLSIEANNYKALSYKITLLIKQKRFSDAQPYASRMIAQHPDMPNGYIQSVQLLMLENKKNEAISLMEEAYKKVKEKKRILEVLVSLYVALKDFDVAISKVQTAISENGENAELYILLAEVQNKSGRVNDSKSSLSRAMTIKPDWNKPYLLLANIYMVDKDSQKAIDTLKQGLIQLKADLKLTFFLAKIYEDLSDYNAAISEYKKAYEKHPDNIILINNLASLLSEYTSDEKSLKLAKELADKLKELDPPMLLDTVGWVYYKIGDYAESVNILKTVVEKAPDSAVFNYHLGMALYKSGDMAAAKIYLSNALGSDSDFLGKENAAIYLKKIK